MTNITKVHRLLKILKTNNKKKHTPERRKIYKSIDNVLYHGLVGTWFDEVQYLRFLPSPSLTFLLCPIYSYFTNQQRKKICLYPVPFFINLTHFKKCKMRE
jgi:hypothetical protein